MNVAMEFIETLESALDDSIEYAISFDGKSGYCPIGYEDKLFKTEREAMMCALRVDDSFQKVRDLKLSDMVVPVYDDDDFLIYYISEKEAKTI